MSGSNKKASLKSGTAVREDDTSNGIAAMSAVIELSFAILWCFGINPKKIKGAWWLIKGVAKTWKHRAFYWECMRGLFGSDDGPPGGAPALAAC